MEKFSLVVKDALCGQRLDHVVAQSFKEFSRGQLQKWIKDGNIKVNDHAKKSNYKVKESDEISITVPDAKALAVFPENILLDIVYEDSDVVVVNKERGMVVHPGAGHFTKTLVNALLYHCQDLPGINGVIRPGIVHRIDKDTSGLLMVAKNDYSHEFLVKQLQEKTVTRRYLCLVDGVISHDTATIDAPIGRDKLDRKKMTVTEVGGKKAITHIKVLERFENATFLECHLETGRTHQIRVHLKYIGFPIIGDPKYGLRKTRQIGGQALHASKLGFTHPTSGKRLEFSADVPPYFQKLLNELASF